MISFSHTLKQSAKLSGESVWEATGQDKTREGKVIKSWREQVPGESIEKIAKLEGEGIENKQKKEPKECKQDYDLINNPNLIIELCNSS